MPRWCGQHLCYGSGAGGCGIHFCAAVDFLSVQENVDSERIGIIGICGWGGMAINAAAIDTRIKATAAMTMYDMTRVTANGYLILRILSRHAMRRKKP